MLAYLWVLWVGLGQEGGALLVGGITFITFGGWGLSGWAELLNGTPFCRWGSARWAGPRPGKGGFIGCLCRKFLGPARADGVTWS